MKRRHTAAVPAFLAGAILLSACGNSVSTTEGQPVSGVTFSNVRAVTADDFKYSWERMLNPNTAGPMTGGSFWGGVHGAQDFYAGTTTSIPGFKVIDPSTLEIDLDTPN